MSKDASFSAKVECLTVSKALLKSKCNHDHIWVGTEHVGYRLKQRNESGRGWASGWERKLVREGQRWRGIGKRGIKVIFEDQFFHEPL